MANTKTYFDTLVSATSAEDSALIVIQTQSNSDLDTMKKIDLGSVRQPTNDKIAFNANAITAEKERAKASEASYASEASSALADESSRAQASEASLATSVTSETSRAVSAENTISANLLTESSRAKASEASLATKITTSINALDVSEIGENGAYISRVEEEDGKILASATRFDRTINANSTDNNAPTSLAVKKLIESLDVALVGSDSATPKSVITSIKEEDGKIIATFANVATAISNNPNTIPTTQAVYNMEQSAILAALGALDYQNGYDGYYIKKIKQEDGQIEVTLQKFDTYNRSTEVWSSSASENNVPTTLAVENRVDVEAASRASAIEALDYTSVGSAGSFVQKVDETDGIIKETIVAFENKTLASYTSSNAASYSARTDVAPTVKAVTDQVKRLDQRIDALDYTSIGADGYFIQKVSQTDGKISEVRKAFENGNIKNSSDTTTAPTVKAVADQVERLDQRVDDEIASRASAIDALDYTSVGAAGSFVQKVDETNGVISETIVAFENGTIATHGSYSSNADVAPTVKAVTKQIKRLDDRVDDEIASRASAINALDYTSVGGNGSFVQKVNQTDGKISETIVAFENGDIQNSSDTAVAPTVKAVADQIERLDQRVNDEIASRASAINALDYTSSGGNGSFVQKVDEINGVISETIVAFENENIATNGSYSSNANVAPTVRAVTEQIKRVDDRINDLDFTGEATTGTFVRAINQTDGQISENVKEFFNDDISKYISSEAGREYASSVDVAPTVRAVSAEIKRLDDVVLAISGGIIEINVDRTGGKGQFIQDIAQNAGFIEPKAASFVTSIASSTTASNNNIAPTEHAVRTAITDAVNALDVSSVGSDGYYLKAIKETDGKISATKQKFDTYNSSSRAWVTGPSDNNAPTSQAVEDRIEEAKRQIIQETEAMVYLGAVVSLANLKDKAEHSGREYHYLEGDTYIANGEFNLDDSASPSSDYEVNIGDFIIVKYGVKSDIYNKDNFDIVGGSKRAIMFDGSSAASGNFLMFSNESGINAIDSGENAETLNARVVAASESAAAAAISAACSASSAEFAWGQAEPFVIEAACAASKAQSSSDAAVVAKTGAEAAESAAVIAKTGAQAAESAAVIAKTGAQAAKNAAVSAQTGAQAAESAAVIAKTGAQAAKNAAVSAQTGAEAAKNAAVSAKTGAQAAESAAVSAQTGAQAAESAAISAMTGAQSSSDAAVAAMTGAQDASDAAVAAKDAAVAAMTGAQDAESAANTSKNNAADYESAAESAAIDAATAKADAENASDAAVSAMTGAQAAVSAAVSAQTGAQAASTAAVSAQTGAQAASDAAVSAKTGAQAAESAAASAKTGAQAAESAAVSAQTGAQAAESAAVIAKTGAQAAETAAVSAKTGAEAASTAAVSAMTGAQAAETAAVSAQTGAEAASDAAVSAKTGAQAASTAAISAMTGAQDASEAAVIAKTGAQAAETAAVSAKTAAVSAQTGAETAESAAVIAKTGAEAAESAAVSAKNAAVSAQTGAEAASDAAVSAKTGAEDSAAKAAQFASDSNLYEIKAACEEAAAIASSAVSNLTFATQTKAGIVSTAAQTFGGVKTFNNGIAFGSSGGSISSSGGATFAGTVTANDFEAVSSRKLKENIKPTLVSALDLIETVKVVDFNYINDDEKTPHIGFIAEDTDKLLSTPHQNKMDYTNCIGALLKAVQEITKGMEELKREIERLK